jgi:hypothetical protein
MMIPLSGITCQSLHRKLNKPPATDLKVLISAAHPVISAPSCTRIKSRLARDSRRIRRRHTQIPCSKSHH